MRLMRCRSASWVGTDSPSFEHPANINLRSAHPDLVPEMEAAVGGRETFDESTWIVAHRLMLSAGRLHVDQAGGALASVPADRVTLAIFPWRFSGGEASVCRVIAYV
jgi:arylformamidase